MPKKKNDTLNYQDALQELQTIVDTIEKTDLPVDQVIQLVKRANELLDFCKSTMQQSGDTLAKLSSKMPDS